jgi:uncharacterized protein
MPRTPKPNSQQFVLLAVCVAIFAGCVKQTAVEATPEAAKKFLKLKGYESDEKGLFAAVAERDQASVNAFLAAGIDPNLRSSRDGRTALISAAAIGDLPIVKTLIQGHADVNVKDSVGYTALFHAIEARYDEVADALLAQPTLDLNARGKNGVTALISFVWRDRPDAVKSLLDRGADANLQDNDGDTALHGAAQNGKVEIVKMLLMKGADSNVKNKVGGTSLMWAAVYGNREVVQLLLDHGADPARKDVDGMTALDWAVKNNRTSVIDTLRKSKRVER